jgi:PIN domain nuclease of toxin-antitoxin system
MRLLLDTHAFLWFANGDNRLPEFARSAVEDAGNEAFVSVASVWEMAIKHNLGKLHFTEPLNEFLARELSGFEILPIKLSHALQTAYLPFHHRDPFDRLLAAVCQTDALPIVSVDQVFDAYGIDRLWNSRAI